MDQHPHNITNVTNFFSLNDGFDGGGAVAAAAATNATPTDEYQYSMSAMSSSFSSSWKGICAATVTVLVTTLDDSVWLLRFVGSPFTSTTTMTAVNVATNTNSSSNGYSTNVRIIHAIVFLITLETLSIICCCVAVLVRQGFIVTTSSSSTTYGRSDAGNTSFAMDNDLLEIRLDIVATAFCWILAAFFFVRKMLRRRQREKTKRQQKLQKTNDNDDKENSTTDQHECTTYGSIPNTNEVEDVEEEQENQPLDTRERRSCAAQIWTVVTLTSIGFLDEISYFPTLVMGKVFTTLELCIGTLFAGMLILLIQMFLSRQCAPVIEFVDRTVPLHGIIAVFATILTISLVWDVYQYKNDNS